MLSFWIEMILVSVWMDVHRLGRDAELLRVMEIESVRLGPRSLLPVKRDLSR